MHPGAFSLAVFLVLTGAAAAEAQSLRGSAASLTRQNRQARQHDYSYLDDPGDVKRFAEAGLLVEIPGNGDYKVAQASFPYARPAVKTFLERLGRQHRVACGEPIIVTSLVRPESRQPRNASDRSVHPTGMAVDLRRNDKPACREWMEETLLYLEEAGVIEATRERRPPHYHIAVFPRPYHGYVAEHGAELVEAPVAAGDTVVYHVRRGDSLWEIARRYGITVQAIKEANGLRSSRVFPGQELRIPSGA